MRNRGCNGDTRADLVWRNTTTGQVYLMQMNDVTVTGGAVVYAEPDQSWKIMGP